MRTSIASILVAGGMLALGACATSLDPADMPQAGRSARCGPEGARTDDGRQDRPCASIPAHAPREIRSPAPGGSLSSAVDRSLRRGG